MAKRHRRLDEELVQGALLDDAQFLRGIVEGVLQHLLEAEITEHIGAARYERTDARTGHRNGYKPRKLLPWRLWRCTSRGFRPGRSGR